MADTDAPLDAAPKTSKKPLIIGVVLALLLGGGGFYATYSGMILGNDASQTPAADPATPLPDIAFVPIDPLVITLGSAQDGRNLRFTAQIEVAGPYVSDVALLLPRIVDVMNGYLRALDPAQLDDPAMLLRIRAQLLRRIQMVTGDGRVRDLLVTEFVLN